MVLYHYTTGQGLYGIFHSKQLHCSNINFLNDPSEHSYFSEILTQVFKKSPKLKQIYNGLFNQSYLNAVLAPFDDFIVSFSQNSDSLSMWNYYAKGNGYNLGIDVDAVVKYNRKHPNISIQKIELVYDKAVQIRETLELLEKFASEYKRHQKLREQQKNTSNEDDYYSIEFDLLNIMEDFNGELYKQRLRYKHHAYEREEEIRLLISEDESVQKSTKFKVLESGVFVEFFPLEFDAKTHIKSITSHPLNGELHLQGIEKFVHAVAGYNNKIKLKPSKIPFRSV